MDAYTTINNMWEISQNTSYLLGSIDMGIEEFMGAEYHVDDKLQLMMSCGSHTKRSHKSITQTNKQKYIQVKGVNASRLLVNAIDG